MKEIQARCPVCNEWWTIPKAELGHSGRCNNCGHTVRLIPRSSQAKIWRGLFVMIFTIILFGLVLWFDGFLG